MARFHESGTICEAHKRACPIGASDAEHIEAGSIQEFETKLAERMEAQGDSFGTASKNVAPVKPAAATQPSNTTASTTVAAQSNVEVYRHPQGKTITIHPDGRVVATGPNGEPARTSATAEKLRKGYGRWQLTSGSVPAAGAANASNAKQSAVQKSDSSSLSPEEQDALVDEYDGVAEEKKATSERLQQLMREQQRYDHKYAAAQGRASYMDYRSQGGKRVSGFNPDPRGYTRIEPTPEQKQAREEARKAAMAASERLEAKQTELERAGLGHRIPDEGNTIRVNTHAQKWLLMDELQGQISDGHWENTQGNPWQDWSNAKVVVDPKNPGRNFNTTKDNYQLNSSELLSIIGGRMVDSVRERTGDKEYSDKAMRKDLKDLRNIFKTKRNQVDGD